MSRPPKWRRVAFIPQITYFKPAGIPLRALEEVRLSVEEAEAVRLKDLENLEQKDCAQRMNVSRPTFHRVLGSARQKIADALLHGKAIRIEGGKFQLALPRFRCFQGHEWELPLQEAATPSPVCPRCQGPPLVPLPPVGLPPSGRGRGWRGGRP